VWCRREQQLAFRKHFVFRVSWSIILFLFSCLVFRVKGVLCGVQGFGVGVGVQDLSVGVSKLRSYWSRTISS
jgi:hypothetical protein